MTESPDDKVLDDYMSRDSAVSRAYRNMDTAEIPSAVDAAVLAQARAAVDRQQSKRRPTWTRWSVPVALAATVVIGVSVLLESGVEEKVYYPTPTRVQEAPQELESRDATAAEAIEQVKEPPATTPSAPAPVDSAKQSQLKAERALARRKQDERADAAPAAGAAFKPDAAPIPEAVPPPITAEQSAANAETANTGAAQPFEADKLEKKTVEEERAPAALYSRTRVEAPRMPAPAAPQAMADRQVGQLSNAVAAPRLSPEVWLEQIRTLRRDGKVLEADEQWREFVDAYPEVVVPEDDAARPADG